VPTPPGDQKAVSVYTGHNEQWGGTGTVECWDLLITVGAHDVIPGSELAGGRTKEMQYLTQLQERANWHAFMTSTLKVTVLGPRKLAQQQVYPVKSQPRITLLGSSVTSPLLLTAKLMVTGNGVTALSLKIQRFALAMAETARASQS
jgi:hypothetical protein